MQEFLRDPDVMRDVLRRRMLRAACSAVARLTAVASGRLSAETDQLRACGMLARLGPQLVGELVAEPDRFDAPEWWTARKIMLLECLDEASEHEYADAWGHCFRHHGAQPPHFNTMAEAREYGRRRWRWRNDPQRCPEDFDSKRMFESYEKGESLP